MPCLRAAGCGLRPRVASLYYYAAGSRYASCGTATVRARARWPEPAMVTNEYAGGVASRDRAFPPRPPRPPKSVPPRRLCMRWYGMVSPFLSPPRSGPCRCRVRVACVRARAPDGRNRSRSDQDARARPAACVRARGGGGATGSEDGRTRTTVQSAAHSTFQESGRSSACMGKKGRLLLRWWSWPAAG